MLSAAVERRAGNACIHDRAPYSFPAYFMPLPRQTSCSAPGGARAQVMLEFATERKCSLDTAFCDLGIPYADERGARTLRTHRSASPEPDVGERMSLQRLLTLTEAPAAPRAVATRAPQQPGATPAPESGPPPPPSPGQRSADCARACSPVHSAFAGPAAGMARPPAENRPPAEPRRNCASLDGHAPRLPRPPTSDAVGAAGGSCDSPRAGKTRWAVFPRPARPPSPAGAATGCPPACGAGAPGQVAPAPLAAPPGPGRGRAAAAAAPPPCCPGSGARCGPARTAAPAAARTAAAASGGCCAKPCAPAGAAAPAAAQTATAASGGCCVKPCVPDNAAAPAAARTATAASGRCCAKPCAPDGTAAPAAARTAAAASGGCCAKPCALRAPSACCTPRALPACCPPRTPPACCPPRAPTSGSDGGCGPQAPARCAAGGCSAAACAADREACGGGEGRALGGTARA